MDWVNLHRLLLPILFVLCVQTTCAWDDVASLQETLSKPLVHYRLRYLHIDLDSKHYGPSSYGIELSRGLQLVKHPHLISEFRSHASVSIWSRGDAQRVEYQLTRNGIVGEAENYYCSQGAWFTPLEDNLNFIDSSRLFFREDPLSSLNASNSFVDIVNQSFMLQVLDKKPLLEEVRVTLAGSPWARGRCFRLVPSGSSPIRANSYSYLIVHKEGSPQGAELVFMDLAPDQRWLISQVMLLSWVELSPDCWRPRLGVSMGQAVRASEDVTPERALEKALLGELGVTESWGFLLSVATEFKAASDEEVSDDIIHPKPFDGWTSYSTLPGGKGGSLGASMHGRPVTDIPELPFIPQKVATTLQKRTAEVPPDPMGAILLSVMIAVVIGLALLGMRNLRARFAPMLVIGFCASWSFAGAPPNEVVIAGAGEFELNVHGEVTAPQAGFAKHVIWITNETSETLLIASAKSECWCISAEIRIGPIDPGETVPVELSLSSRDIRPQVLAKWDSSVKLQFIREQDEQSHASVRVNVKQRSSGPVWLSSLGTISRSEVSDPHGYSFALGPIESDPLIDPDSINFTEVITSTGTGIVQRVDRGGGRMSPPLIWFPPVSNPNDDRIDLLLKGSAQTVKGKSVPIEVTYSWYISDVTYVEPLAIIPGGRGITTETVTLAPPPGRGVLVLHDVEPAQGVRFVSTTPLSDGSVTLTFQIDWKALPPMPTPDAATTAFGRETFHKWSPGVSIARIVYGEQGRRGRVSTSVRIPPPPISR